MSIKHKFLTPADGHIIHSFEFETYDDMINTDKIFSVKDINKLALITSTGEYYILTQHVPPVWKNIAQSNLTAAMYLSKYEVTNVNYNSDNNPTLIQYNNSWRCEIRYSEVDNGQTLKINIRYVNDIDVIIEEWEHYFEINNDYRLIKTIRLQ